MASVIPKTVGESLYWSYTNLAMAFASSEHGEPTYQQIDYIIRNKLYYGLLRGTMQLGSFLMDERERIATSDVCCYCGRQDDLTLDHLVPQFKGGWHSADNLVVACRSCNSSKRALDLLEWMAKRGQFPPLRLLRRYLKLAIHYCVEHGLMDFALEPADSSVPKQASLFDDLETNVNSGSDKGIDPAWPFAIGLIPHAFPEPADLVARVSAEEEEES